jgi:short-subunit dehydrogenase
MRTLDSKVVAITGAGSGIGRALAVEMARHGALLALSDVDEAGLEVTAGMVAGTGRREMRTDRLDVSERTGVAAYATTVADHFGRVNVIVNNAGVALSGDFVDLAYEDLEWITGVNFWGVVHGTKEFLPHLIASGDGHVVNMSSLFGLVSVPGQSAYNATKYAVRGLSEALRQELLIAGHPVGVTVVHPGGVKTAIARNARVAEGIDHSAAARRFEEKLATMEPERAARIIVKAVLADKARVLVGLDAHAIHQAAKLAGSRYQDVIAYAGRRSRRAGP